MKFKFIMIPAMLTALAGCGEEPIALKILSPTLAPSVAMYTHALDANYETTSNPAAAILQFQSDNYDVIIAPTHGGLNQIVNQNAQFKIAATITFGNFYIISCGFDDDEELNPGDKILAFQENDIPGKLFKYVYGSIGLDYKFVANADMIKDAINNDGVYDGVQYDYIFAAEPVVTVYGKEVFRNVQEDFKEKSGNKLITQASVFVRNSADKKAIDNFLSSLKKDIEDGIADPTLIEEGIKQAGNNEEQINRFGFAAPIVRRVQAHNGFGLGYKSAFDIKGDIETFINLITNNSFGTLNEEVFYK